MTHGPYQNYIIEYAEESTNRFQSMRPVLQRFCQNRKRVSQAMKVSGEQVLKHSKRTDHAEARKVLFYYASMPGIPSKETGEYLGMQQAAVSHASRKGGYIAKDRHIQIV